jgi:hypothetical protein
MDSAQQIICILHSLQTEGLLGKLKGETEERRWKTASTPHIALLYTTII